jgi:hypothetical protein
MALKKSVQCAAVRTTSGATSMLEQKATHSSVSTWACSMPTLGNWFAVSSVPSRMAPAGWAHANETRSAIAPVAACFNPLRDRMTAPP